MTTESQSTQNPPKEQWASKLGLVLAMAGNAVGLGNFLRFPSLAAQHGGGAFMIPYFVALLLLGVPLMWVEWTMGRYGGQFGHTTTPGMFVKMSRWRPSRILGSLGVALPLLFVVFYTYLESWTLAYAYYSATGVYFAEGEQAELSGVPDGNGDSATPADQSILAVTPTTDSETPVLTEKEQATFQFKEALKGSHTSVFLKEYQGVAPPENRKYFVGLSQTVIFWLIAVIINCVVISYGVSGGIEKLAKIAMPMLFVFAIILVVRVLTLPGDPAHPDRTPWAGLNFVWEPNFSALADFKVWLFAAGQIFFTLSIGTGTIQCFASYLKKDDDCVLTGLTTAATNEFAEVVLGGSIAIPVAAATFGVAATQVIASEGSFNLGFVAMPLIFEQMPFGRVFATLWFSLLFFAGITSSVALSQPLASYLYEFYGLGRKAAAFITGAAMIIFGLPILLFVGKGYLDQYDFWVGTFGLAVFSLVEIIIFGWSFGAKEMWAEINRSSTLKVPRIFYFIIRYVAPAYLFILLTGWIVLDLYDENSIILLRGVDEQDIRYNWASRGTIVLVIAVFAIAVGMTRISTEGDKTGDPADA